MDLPSYPTSPASLQLSLELSYPPPPPTTHRLTASVGGILVHCKTRLQVPDSRVQAWSQQSCLRRDKIQYFGSVLQNSPLTSHKMQLNRATLTVILPCQ